MIGWDIIAAVAFHAALRFFIMVRQRTAYVTALIVAAAIAVPALSSAGVVVEVGVAPPAPQVEVVPRCAPAMSGHPVTGHGAMVAMSGWAGITYMSVAAITGYPMPGYRPAPAGTTLRAIGSAERPPRRSR